MYLGASWGLLGAEEKLDGWALNCWRGLAGSWSFVGGRGAAKSAGKRTATFNRKLESFGLRIDSRSLKPATRTLAPSV